MGKLALDIRLLGRDDMREFLRIAGINIYDVLQENFDSDLLKGALALDGVLGTILGPRSNNSVFTALHRMSGNTGEPAGALSLPRGGMGAVSDALAAAARKHGAQIRTSSPVARITAGWRQRIRRGTRRAASRSPRRRWCPMPTRTRTFLGLLGARNLEAGFAQQDPEYPGAKAMRPSCTSHSSGLPEFTGLRAEQLGERLVIAPDLHYLENTHSTIPNTASIPPAR